MRRLLILAGLGAGAFYAWKRMNANRRNAEDELAEDMYGSALIHQQADVPSPLP